MTQQNINLGSGANTGTGDPLLTAFTKTQANFTEIYSGGAVANTGGVLKAIVAGTFTLASSGATSSTLSVPGMQVTSQIYLSAQEGDAVGSHFLSWVVPASRVTGVSGSETFSHPANSNTITYNYMVVL